MKAPRTVVATIESLAQTGEGVAHVDARMVLVPGTLPGERVRLRITGAARAAERSIETMRPLAIAEPTM